MAIVLLHGLARDKRIMQPLADYLAQQDPDQQIHNFSYPSRKNDFPFLVNMIQERIIQACDQSKPVHLIGHSMGGIIIRLMLQQWRPKQLGRVLQVGSPNHGTVVVDFLNRSRLFKWFYGTPASRLGTDSHGIMHQLQAVDYELAVIAADRVALKDLFFDKYVFDCDNDGLVSVQSTQVEGMKDFTIVHDTHVGVVSNPETLQHVNHFLQSGSFIAS